MAKELAFQRGFQGIAPQFTLIRGPLRRWLASWIACAMSSLAGSSFTGNKDRCVGRGDDRDPVLSSARKAGPASDDTF